MLTTRTPFRVSFCGGGSDLPEFYRKNGGCVLSTSIDKYIYITMMSSFYPDRILVKYSQVENVNDFHSHARSFELPSCLFLMRVQPTSTQIRRKRFLRTLRIMPRKSVQELSTFLMTETWSIGVKVA